MPQNGLVACLNSASWHLTQNVPTSCSPQPVHWFWRDRTVATLAAVSTLSLGTRNRRGARATGFTRTDSTTGVLVNGSAATVSTATGFTRTDSTTGALVNGSAATGAMFNGPITMLGTCWPTMGLTITLKNLPKPVASPLQVHCSLCSSYRNASCFTYNQGSSTSSSHSSSSSSSSSRSINSAWSILFCLPQLCQLVDPDLVHSGTP